MRLEMTLSLPRLWRPGHACRRPAARPWPPWLPRNRYNCIRYEYNIIIPERNGCPMSVALTPESHMRTSYRSLKIHTTPLGAVFAVAQIFGVRKPAWLLGFMKNLNDNRVLTGEVAQNDAAGKHLIHWRFCAVCTTCRTNLASLLKYDDFQKLCFCWRFVRLLGDKPCDLCDIARHRRPAVLCDRWCFVRHDVQYA